jgi:hypothetical protein
MPSKLNEIVNLIERLDNRVTDAVNNAIKRGTTGA